MADPGHGERSTWSAPPSGTVPPGPEEAQRGNDQELHVGRLFGFLVGLALLLGSAAVVCLVLYRALADRLQTEDPAPSPVPEARERVLPPEPRLQENPPEDMAALRARADEILSTYGVVDMASGTVRIPIERAIDLAARGVKPALGPMLDPGQGDVPGPGAPAPPGREPSSSGDVVDGGAPEGRDGGAPGNDGGAPGRDGGAR